MYSHGSDGSLILFTFRNKSSLSLLSQITLFYFFFLHLSLFEILEYILVYSDSLLSVTEQSQMEDNFIKRTETRNLVLLNNH